jgi:hypothetical protein
MSVLYRTDRCVCLIWQSKGDRSPHQSIGRPSISWNIVRWIVSSLIDLIIRRMFQEILGRPMDWRENQDFFLVISWLTNPCAVSQTQSIITVKVSPGSTKVMEAVNVRSDQWWCNVNFHDSWSFYRQLSDPWWCNHQIEWPLMMQSSNWMLSDDESSNWMMSDHESSNWMMNNEWWWNHQIEWWMIMESSNWMMNEWNHQIEWWMMNDDGIIKLNDEWMESSNWMMNDDESSNWMTSDDDESSNWMMSDHESSNWMTNDHESSDWMISDDESSNWMMNNEWWWNHQIEWRMIMNHQIEW